LGEKLLKTENQNRSTGGTLKGNELGKGKDDSFLPVDAGKGDVLRKQRGRRRGGEGNVTQGISLLS